MTKWILTAEADKIQHFVFRSSRLREVVGGSQLLTDFCDKVTRAISPEDRIVADGGAFTLLFDDPTQADDFGRDLAQQYYELTNCTLTVAKLTEWNGKPEDFPAANRQAHLSLASAKRQGRAAAAVGQGPYMAFCASCGIGLASTHRPLAEGDSAQYVCDVCLRKAEKRGGEGSRFLREFKQAVVSDRFNDFDLPVEPEKLTGAWEARNYVAYLVADGNGMGKVFRQCKDPGQLHNLSTGLENVVRQSLAAPTRKLMQQKPRGTNPNLIPVLPLILGGDDVFILLPASYALDFARQFCLEYETRMAALLKRIGLPDIRATMSAAVVICKSKYPHTLVHKHGERLLQEAKRLSKAVAVREKERPDDETVGPDKERKSDHNYSSVHFDVILGSRLPRETGETQRYQNTLAPYWVYSPEVASEFPQNVGLSLDCLLAQRLALARQQIPNRRLIQLRTLYDPSRLPDKTAEALGIWSAELARIKARMARNEKDVEILEETLRQLGGDRDGYWLPINRPGATTETIFEGHGLPDLIQMWDFSWYLDQERSVYTAQEEA